MRRLGRLCVLAVSLFSLAGCGSTPAADHGADDIAVQVATARTLEVPETLHLVGSLLAWERVSVSAEVAGRVAEIRVDLGDAVRAGDLAVRLDGRELRLQADAARAALAQAEAVLARARANHARGRALHERQVLSQEVFDGLISELRVAEANRAAAATQLALAGKHVEDATIRSPLDGFVAARFVSPGQYVVPPAPVVEIVAIDPLKLRFDVPDRAAASIREGLAVRVESEGSAVPAMRATVTRIGSALDPVTRTLPVECALPNPDAQLKPGQFVRAVVELGLQPAVTLPRAAIDTFAGTHRAFVVLPDGTVEPREVALGRDLGEEVAIASGIADGEVVAVSQLERLAHGVRVQPVESSSAMVR